MVSGILKAAVKESYKKEMLLKNRYSYPPPVVWLETQSFETEHICYVYK